jgi:hypothetical protein
MIRQLALAGALALSVSLAGTAHATDQDPPIRTEWMPCAFDEPSPYSNCVWDAKHQGNGIGRSFFAGKNERIWVLPHHIAHSLLGPENRREYVPCDWPVSSDPVLCIWEESVWLNWQGDATSIPRTVSRFLMSRTEIG